jgi:hypothetical protein
MILETLVTTLDPKGRAHCAPMGIVLDDGLPGIVLRPFGTAATARNLERLGEGVVNFTDDVLVMARAALGPVSPPVQPSARVRPPRLQAACSWKEFVVTEGDRSGERFTLRAAVVAEGRARDFLGFNRARHAVIEATILATRLHLLDPEVIEEDIARLRPLVEKTGGARERLAFAFVAAFVREARTAGADAAASKGTA